MISNVSARYPNKNWPDWPDLFRIEHRKRPVVDVGHGDCNELGSYPRHDDHHRHDDDQHELWTVDADALVRELVTTSVAFRDLEVATASLEEAFLALTSNDTSNENSIDTSIDTSSEGTNPASNPALNPMAIQEMTR